MRIMGVMITIVLVLALTASIAGAGSPGPCIPERPIPPESVGSIGVPFDVPIWPTLLKTEFNILPWVNFGMATVCLPYTGKSFQIPAPCFSLKPIPVWIPWLRPLDAEFTPRTPCLDP